MDVQAVKDWLANKQGSDTGEAIQPKVLVLAAVVMELEALVNGLSAAAVIEKEDEAEEAAPKSKSKSKA